jgi:hypothetical protein
MKYLKLAAATLACGFIFTVQAAAPKASGYVSDYGRLIEGEYLEAYWIDMVDIERSKSPTVMLGDISIIGVKDHKGVTVDDCVGWLKGDLQKDVISSGHTGAPYKLDLAITFMDPGSAAKRIWAGEFGAGHAKLQIEGKVTDIDSGKVVAEFAERRRSSGAIGVEDLGGDAGPHIIEHLVSLISDDINSELQASFTIRE